MASFVIYGDTKVGKTWLASTAPRPVLFIDAEAGGMRHVPGPHVEWDPSGPPPDMPDDAVCAVTVTTFHDVVEVVQWISQGGLPFRSVVIDSVTEAQSRLVRQIAPNSQPRIQDWGAIGRELDDAVAQLRDDTHRQGMHCVLVCGLTHDTDGKAKPMLRGYMRDHLGYKVDIIGCLHRQTDEAGESRRLLQLVPDAKVQAGRRDGGALDDWEWDPDLTDLCERLEGE